MNSGWTKAIIALMSVFVLLVAVGQVFFASGEGLATETAYSYDYDEEIPFTGVILRDESVIYNTDPGVLSYEQDDGYKAGNSTVIARRYKSDKDITALREIEKLKEQIKLLESAELLIGTDNSQLEAISAQINESHSAIISGILSGDLLSAAKERDNLLCAMCKREITLDKDCVGYDEKKKELSDRISYLQSQISGGVQEVRAGGTGYFISSVDGYEGEFGYSDIDMMTADKITAITRSPRKTSANGAIGKLVSDYHWRAAAVLDSSKLLGVYEGSTATLRIGSGSRLYKTDVISVRNCGDGKAVYVFECDNFLPEVVGQRTASFKLVMESYGGLRVSRGAIRYNDAGETGVYTVRGKTLVFKKINVAYWGEGYIICTQESGDDYLKLYDKVVVGGKDLYDGKLI